MLSHSPIPPVVGWFAGVCESCASVEWLLMITRTPPPPSPPQFNTLRKVVCLPAWRCFTCNWPFSSSSSSWSFAQFRRWFLWTLSRDSLLWSICELILGNPLFNHILIYIWRVIWCHPSLHATIIAPPKNTTTRFSGHPPPYADNYKPQLPDDYPKYTWWVSQM